MAPEHNDSHQLDTSQVPNSSFHRDVPITPWPALRRKKRCAHAVLGARAARGACEVRNRRQSRCRGGGWGRFIWVCLKIVYPLNPMVNDHYPY